LAPSGWPPWKSWGGPDLGSREGPGCHGERPLLDPHGGHHAVSVAVDGEEVEPGGLPLEGPRQVLGLGVAICGLAQATRGPGRRGPRSLGDGGTWPAGGDRAAPRRAKPRGSPRPSPEGGSRAGEATAGARGPTPYPPRPTPRAALQPANRNGESRVRVRGRDRPQTCSRRGSTHGSSCTRCSWRRRNSSCTSPTYAPPALPGWPRTGGLCTVQARKLRRGPLLRGPSGPGCDWGRRGRRVQRRRTDPPSVPHLGGGPAALAKGRGEGPMGPLAAGEDPRLGPPQCCRRREACLRPIC